MRTCRLICFDDACRNNGYADAIGGAGVYIPQLWIVPGYRRHCNPSVTNQRAELLGLIEALRVGLQVKRDHDPDLWFCVDIRMNPKSVIGWLGKWKERGWSIVLGNQSQVNLLRLQPCFEMIWRMKVARAFRYIPREDYRSDVMTRRMDLAEISIC